jgi:hypothetical protein
MILVLKIVDNNHRLMIIRLFDEIKFLNIFQLLVQHFEMLYETRKILKKIVNLLDLEQMICLELLFFLFYM